MMKTRMKMTAHLMTKVCLFVYNFLFTFFTITDITSIQLFVLHFSGGEHDLVNDPYSSNVGRVVWAENTDKKTKAKHSWFLALIVAPTASETTKIRTKKEFLIRSFKDGRYYTVSKKDTHRFRHNESPSKKNDNPALKEGKVYFFWKT